MSGWRPSRPAGAALVELQKQKQFVSLKIWSVLIQLAWLSALVLFPEAQMLLEDRCI